MILNGEGGRLTEERRALLRTLCSIDGHFDPEMLEQALLAQGYRVSLATVYRNISMLVRAGIIRRTDVEATAPSGGAQYEHVWGRTHHDHLICSRCGKSVEFRYPAIDVLQEAVAKEHGFKLERHSLELVGVCGDCGLAPREKRAPAERKASPA